MKKKVEEKHILVIIVGSTPFVTPQGTLQGSPLIASSSVGSESASHYYKSLFEHGFELSRRRKKRPVGTCCNSTYEWAPT